MSDDDRTRRRLLSASAGALALGLAGCTGSDGGNGTAANGDGATTAAAETGTAGSTTAAETAGETAERTAEPGGSYSVTMSPVGTVEFDAPPESMIAYDRQWLHMAYELGHGDAVSGFDDPGGTWFTLHETLPGVSFDAEGVESFVGEQVDKELIYEIGPDLIAMDPLRAPTLEGLDGNDVEELRRNVAPFFANRYSATKDYEGDQPYEYYTLYELYEKYGEAFREQERVAALRNVDRELTETIQSDLPPESERPTVMKAGYFDGKFYTYNIEQGGYGTRHYRKVGAKSAIRETYGDDVPFEFGGSVDMETLIEIDPDVLVEGSSLFYSEIDGYSHEGIVETVADEPGAEEVTAIRTGAHYPGGTPYVGPVAYLFYSELLAKYLYPETFGEFPGVGEIPEEEQLFHRERVAEIVDGNV